MFDVKTLVEKSLDAANPYNNVIHFVKEDLNDLENTPENAALIADLRALLAACRRNEPQHVIDPLLDKIAAHHSERATAELIKEIEQTLAELADSAGNIPLRAAYNVLLMACHNRDEKAKGRAFKVLKDEFGILLHWRDRCIADIQKGEITYSMLVEHFDADFAIELFADAGVKPEKT